MSKEDEHRIREEMRRLEDMKEEDIDLTEMPEVDFSRSEVGKFYRPVKDQVTLRIDRPVLEWFKANHEKYQTAINQVLLEHMKEQRRAEMRRRAAEEDARETEVNRGE